MKLLFLSISFGLYFSWSSAQPLQEKTHEIRVGYGYLSDIQIAAAFTNAMSTIFSGISGESSSYKSTGPITAGYLFFVSKKISVEPEFNFIKLNFTNHYPSGDVFSNRFSCFNFSTRFDVTYFKTENIRIYSGISLGGTYASYRTTDPSKNNKDGLLLSYQFNFFGVRVGKSWGAFLELGFGRNGLAHVGISRRF